MSDLNCATFLGHLSLQASTNEKMGRKGKWINAVKKALHPESKEKSNQERGKSKKKWFRKKKRSDPKSPKPLETSPTTTAPPPVVPRVVAAPESPKLSEADNDQTKHASNVAVPATKATAAAPPQPVKLSEADKEQTNHAYNVVLATAKAAETAVTAAEVVHLTANASRFASKSEEELAAIKIQTAFRGYMARRTLRALRGLMRLKTVMQGQTVKHQTTNTLKCMQTLARVQGQVRERRLKQAGDNQAYQKTIQQKYEKGQAKVLEKSENLQQNGDGWDSSGKPREQIEAKLQSKHEAAIRRERTMAYAYNHQQPWKPTPMPASTLYVDPKDSHWGWSWLERWLAGRPWETATIPDKDFSNHSSSRVKSSETGISTTEKPSPTSIPKQQPRSANGRLSTSSAPSKPFSTAAKKLRSPSPRASPMTSPRGSTWGLDDDTRSMLSLQSEQSRRNSVTGSFVGDDESLAIGRTVPSYMAPTESAKAKSQETKRDKSVTPDRLSVSSARKRLSYSPSPGRSRPSTSSIADANSISDQHT